MTRLGLSFAGHVAKLFAEALLRCHTDTKTHTFTYTHTLVCVGGGVAKLYNIFLAIEMEFQFGIQ